MHVARNVIAKVSQPDQEAVKKDYWAIFNGIEAPPGEAAISIAQERARGFAETYRDRYPRAVDCLLENMGVLTAHLQFPAEHWGRIRHSNLLERTFGESRRRVKVIGRLPGENSCLSLVWAVLDRASVGWRGLETSVPGIRRLQDLRHQLLGPPEPRNRLIAPDGTAMTQARQGVIGLPGARSCGTRRPVAGLRGSASRRLGSEPHDLQNASSRPIVEGDRVEF